MNISDVARRTGLTPKAIRYYERVGLVPPPARSEAGYRRYDETEVQRLEFIAIAKGAGLGLEEIAEVLEASAGHHTNCNCVALVLERKVRELHERLADLQALHEPSCIRSSPPTATSCRRSRALAIARRRSPGRVRLSLIAAISRGVEISLSRSRSRRSAAPPGASGRCMRRPGRRLHHSSRRSCPSSSGASRAADREDQ